MAEILLFLLYDCLFFFIDFYIKFGKAKQEVVAFVATTLKPLFSVAETSGRFSGYEFDACNICYCFFECSCSYNPLINI